MFNSEYPAVRWLERNGYDVSYIDRPRHRPPRAELIKNHRTFMSVGHDEYWSGAAAGQRRGRARRRRQHRLLSAATKCSGRPGGRPAPTGPEHRDRTLVCYKETHADAKIDPMPAWTGTWRDPRFGPPPTAAGPENALTGTIFTVNGPLNDAIKVPAAIR